MLNITPRKLFTVIIFLALFGFSVRVARDPDLFWHLKTGEYILENGIPHEDPGFSFTSTEREWITHEWLTQVFMFSVYDRLGLRGLSIVFAGLIAIAYGFLFYASDGRPYLAGAATFWGIAASLPFLNARPQMFNILFGAWIVLVSEQIRRGRWSTRWVWSFPVLFLFWVNMHGGFLLGFVIGGVYVVGEAGQLYFSGEREDGLSWSQLQTFVYSGLVSVVVSNINPNTYRMWVYAFETLTSDAMRDTIAEWQSPNFHVWIFWLFGFMVMGTFFIMIFSKRQVLWTDVLFIGGTMFAGLQSVRNIPLFALVAVPILSRHMLGLFIDRPRYSLFSGESADPVPNTTMNRINLFAMVILVIGTLVFAVEQLRDTEQVILDEFPVYAIDWLEEEGLTQARIFNDYEWGGYMILRDVPTFIDGRADIFGDEFIYFYMQTYTRQADWREPLDEHDVEYVLTRTDGGLKILLDEVSEWEIVYEDEVSTIYGRS